MPAAQTTFSLPIRVGGDTPDEITNVIAFFTVEHVPYSLEVFIREELNFKPSCIKTDLTETLRHFGKIDPVGDVAFDKIKYSFAGQWIEIRNDRKEPILSPRKPVITPTTLIQNNA